MEMESDSCMNEASKDVSASQDAQPNNLSGGRSEPEWVAEFNNSLRALTNTVQSMGEAMASFAPAAQCSGDVTNLVKPDAPARRPCKRPVVSHTVVEDESDSDESSDAELLQKDSSRQAASVSDVAANDAYGQIWSEIEQDFDQADTAGPEIASTLAGIVNKRWTTRLSQDKFKAKMGTIATPKNCDNLVTPLVNPEIWSAMPNSHRQRDFQLCATQKVLTSVGSLLAVTTNMLMKAPDDHAGANLDINQLIKLNVDAIALLGHVQQDLSQERRVAIKPILKPEYVGLCKSSNPTTALLFGDDLAGQLGALRAANSICNSAVAVASFARKPDGRFDTFQRQQPFLGRDRFQRKPPPWPGNKPADEPSRQWTREARHPKKPYQPCRKTQ